MDIIQLTGHVKYSITLDPSVWIFDDRKLELAEAFVPKDQSQDSDDYIKRMSSIWDNEVGSTALKPPIQKSVQKFAKEKILTGTFAIPFAPFIANAEPHDQATKLLIEAKHQTVVIPLETAMMAILGFSKDGKPLKEDGPVHFYYGDGSNLSSPVTHITRFLIK